MERTVSGWLREPEYVQAGSDEVQDTGIMEREESAVIWIFSGLWIRSGSGWNLRNRRGWQPLFCDRDTELRVVCAVWDKRYQHNRRKSGRWYLLGSDFCISLVYWRTVVYGKPVSGRWRDLSCKRRRKDNLSEFYGGGTTGAHLIYDEDVALWLGWDEAERNA